MEYLKDIPAATVRQYNQVSPQQQQGWWGHLEERVYSMAKVKALKRKDGRERMRMANQGKLGRGSLLWDASIEACGGAGLFALGKGTSQEKLVPRGAVTQLRGGGATGWASLSRSKEATQVRVTFQRMGELFPARKGEGAEG